MTPNLVSFSAYLWDRFNSDGFEVPVVMVSMMVLMMVAFMVPMMMLMMVAIMVPVIPVVMVVVVVPMVTVVILGVSFHASSFLRSCCKTTHRLSNKDRIALLSEYLFPPLGEYPIGASTPLEKMNPKAKGLRKTSIYY
jgi:hypothetical protein